jgi:hypothetical protein
VDREIESRLGIHRVACSLKNDDRGFEHCQDFWDFYTSKCKSICMVSLCIRVKYVYVCLILLVYFSKIFQKQ